MAKTTAETIGTLPVLQTEESAEYLERLDRRNVLVRIAKLVNQVRLDIFLMDDEIREGVGDKEVTEVGYWI